MKPTSSRPLARLGQRRPLCSRVGIHLTPAGGPNNESPAAKPLAQPDPPPLQQRPDLTDPFLYSKRGVARPSAPRTHGARLGHCGKRSGPERWRRSRVACRLPLHGGALPPQTGQLGQQVLGRAVLIWIVGKTGGAGPQIVLLEEQRKLLILGIVRKCHDPVLHLGELSHDRTYLTYHDAPFHVWYQSTTPYKTCIDVGTTDSVSANAFYVKSMRNAATLAAATNTHRIQVAPFRIASLAAIHAPVTCPMDSTIPTCRSTWEADAKNSNARGV